MKSFKRYIKEVAAANTASFSSGGVAPASAGFAGIGGVLSGDISANLPQKGEGKTETKGVQIIISRAISKGSIVRDKETGSLKFKSVDGDEHISSHAAISKTETDLFARGIKGGVVPTVAQTNAASVAEFIKNGTLELTFDGGEARIVPVEYAPPPLRSTDDDDRVGDDKEEGGTDNIRPGRFIAPDVWEDADGGILVYNPDKEQWEEVDPDAQDEEGEDEDIEPDYDKWELYQEYVDFHHKFIIDILSDDAGEEFDSPFGDTYQYIDYVWHYDDPNWDSRTPGSELYDQNPRPVPKRPSGYDRLDDDYRKWKEENKSTERSGQRDDDHPWNDPRHPMYRPKQRKPSYAPSGPYDPSDFGQTPYFDPDVDHGPPRPPRPRPVKDPRHPMYRAPDPYKPRHPGRPEEPGSFDPDVDHGPPEPRPVREPHPWDDLPRFRDRKPRQIPGLPYDDGRYPNDTPRPFDPNVDHGPPEPRPARKPHPWDDLPRFRDRKPRRRK